MKTGIYHVNFSAGGQNVGDGLVVVKDGTVNGGDPGYLYTGSISESASQVTVQLDVKQWNTQIQSVFGPLKQFGLTLAGTADAAAGTFRVRGAITGHPERTIAISGRHLSDAA